MNLRHDYMVATGGLGTGMLVRLIGDQTLGREESRLADELDQKDRCKLHNVAYVVKRLLGEDLAVRLLGGVGDDEPGRTVLGELRDAGLDPDDVRVLNGLPTLFSFCFTYPNGQGGNITLDHSASAALDVADVDALWSSIDHTGTGMAVAVPEVPLPVRARLLSLAKQRHCYTVASFLSGEMAQVVQAGLLGLCDLIAINIDEALALLELHDDGESSPADVMDRLVAYVGGISPHTGIVMTAGGSGSWSWDGDRCEYASPCQIQPVNTAGAGDAHLGGVLVGLELGLSLAQANGFATIISAQNVLSEDTLAELDWESTIQFAREHGMPLPAAVEQYTDIRKGARR